VPQNQLFSSLARGTLDRRPRQDLGPFGNFCPGTATESAIWIGLDDFRCRCFHGALIENAQDAHPFKRES
jgi:hypothetical protein